MAAWPEGPGPTDAHQPAYACPTQHSVQDRLGVVVRVMPQRHACAVRLQAQPLEKRVTAEPRLLLDDRPSPANPTPEPAAPRTPRPHPHPRLAARGSDAPHAAATQDRGPGSHRPDNAAASSSRDRPKPPPRRAHHARSAHARQSPHIPGARNDSASSRPLPTPPPLPSVPDTRKSNRHSSLTIGDLGPRVQPIGPHVDRLG